MSDVAREHERAGRRVFTVAWHVDYWNHLGYRDPFSQRAFARRQRAYAKAKGSDNIFTPQVMVNTETIRPLSSRGLRRGIDESLKKAAPAKVTLKAGAGRVVRYETAGGPPEAELHLVLVENGLVSGPIPRGENAGATLRHHATARWWTTVPSGEGTVRVDLPTGVDGSRTRVVGLLQHPRTLRLYAVEAMRERLKM